MTRLTLLAATLLATLSAAPSFAHDTGIHADPNEAIMASFDIIETTIVTHGDDAVFTTRVRGEAGLDKPDATGKFEGSRDRKSVV